MAQSGDHLRLALEARLRLGVPLDMTMHHFDDDETIQPEMCANVDFSHSPAGEFLFDAYVSDYLADPRWHGRIIQQPGYGAMGFVISTEGRNLVRQGKDFSVASLLRNDRGHGLCHFDQREKSCSPGERFLSRCAPSK